MISFLRQGKERYRPYDIIIVGQQQIREALHIYITITLSVANVCPLNDVKVGPPLHKWKQGQEPRTLF